MENYSAIKTKEILLFATIWMDLGIMLSEIRQTEKVKHSMVSLISRTLNKHKVKL